MSAGSLRSPGLMTTGIREGMEVRINCPAIPHAHGELGVIHNPGSLPPDLSQVFVKLRSGAIQGFFPHELVPVKGVAHE